jgi:restriction system protein
MKAFFVRALYGQLTSIFHQNDFAAIGWFAIPCNNYADRDEVISHYKSDYPQDGNGRMYQNVSQIYRFWNDIAIGDIVISTYADGSLIIGIANSEPYFKKDSICEFNERINVKWKKEKFERYQLSISTQNTIKSSLTVFNVWQIAEIAKLADITLPPDQVETEKVSLYTEEAIYSSIKTKLATLDATEFEIFVSYILQSLGFEANRRQGGVNDGGVDFEGVLDVMGVSTTKLQVQVKRFENNIIGEKEIRSFRGALKKDCQGTFITLSDFNKKAIASARDEERVRIHLINGKQLVEIFVQQYDHVIQLMDADAMKELMAKLKFQKIIIPA